MIFVGGRSGIETSSVKRNSICFMYDINATLDVASFVICLGDENAIMRVCYKKQTSVNKTNKGYNCQI
jgi:hypothetical protein